MTDSNDNREPHDLLQLTRVELVDQAAPNGAVFDPPQSRDAVPTVSHDRPGTIDPGYIYRAPQRMEPNFRRFRYVLTHKLDTDETEHDASGREVTGLVVVASVYAMAHHSHPDPSLTAESAVEYFKALGYHIGYVAIGEDTAGIWIAGFLTADIEWYGRTEGCEVQADVRADADGDPVVTGLYVKVPAAGHPAATSLTKGDVIKALTVGEFADLPDDTPMIIAKDAEGNDHSPLAGLARAGYIANSTWSGDITDDDTDPHAVRSIVLDPVN